MTAELDTGPEKEPGRYYTAQNHDNKQLTNDLRLNYPDEVSKSLFSYSYTPEVSKNQVDAIGAKVVSQNAPKRVVFAPSFSESHKSGNGSYLLTNQVGTIRAKVGLSLVTEDHSPNCPYLLLQREVACNMSTSILNRSICGLLSSRDSAGSPRTPLKQKRSKRRGVSPCLS